MRIVFIVLVVFVMRSGVQVRHKCGRPLQHTSACYNISSTETVCYVPKCLEQ